MELHKILEQDFKKYCYVSFNDLKSLAIKEILIFVIKAPVGTKFESNPQSPIPNFNCMRKNNL